MIVIFLDIWYIITSFIAFVYQVCDIFSCKAGAEIIFKLLIILIPSGIQPPCNGHS
jgi:hypothetical protein